MTNKKNKSVYWLPLILVPVLIALDRLTKVWAAQRLQNSGDIKLIPGALRLRYLENSGAAFGILQNSRVFFLIFTLIIVAVGIALYVRYAAGGVLNPAHAVLFSMVLAGAVGNLWDRAATGTVIDFIYVELIDFPIFNLADIYITCACIAAFILVIRSARNDRKKV